MMALALIHGFKTWACILLSLMESTDKKECQMVVHTIMKTVPKQVA